MTVIVQRQQEWAELKYLILSKSQQDYRAIRKLFADNQWTPEKEEAFRFHINHALAEPVEKGNQRNAYQHVWGYFKKKATEAEREKYQLLLETFSVEQDKLLPFLKELTQKYQEQYLLQSKLLFDEEVSEKKG
ncbi:YbgA family protein [Candidatus Enterococcus mansonii]|uniref:YbgA family protein n=1 Tax=Candidatus Enterococcus mansonii TaxID=1834181 RepID=UPI000A34A1D3|nr:YbgA family protein [Enterococcus sp. 4G2_DIV0659]